MPPPELALMQGTLEMMILKTLTWGPAHGYAVVNWISHLTGGALQVEEGTLYPALHRLERKGLVESEWGLSENNRRAKFYQLTEEGRAQLRTETSTWARFTEAVGRVLHSVDRPDWASVT